MSKSRAGFIYFIQCGAEGGPIKVGWAVDPLKRMQAHGIGNPFPLEMLAYRAGTIQQEQALHQELDGWIKGEWFEPTPRLLEMVNEAREWQIADAVEQITNFSTGI